MMQNATLNVAASYHLPLLWKHFIGPDMCVIPKVIRGLTRRNPVRMDYTEACSYCYGPKVTGNPANLNVQWKHNGCFCQGVLTLAPHFTGGPRLTASPLG